MNSFFAFDFAYLTPDTDRPRQLAVIFCSRDILEANRLTEKMSVFLVNKPPPDRVVIIASASVSNSLKSLITDENFFDRLPAVTRLTNPPEVAFLTYDEYGTLSSIADRPFGDLRHFEIQMKQNGLLSIFRNRNGILTASPLYHFEKPSGKHSDSFIRAAEVLVSGAEVNFVAFCLLPYLSSDITHIYCDTGSIDAVAYALVQLKKAIKRDLPNPTIDSFGSYDRIEEFAFHGRDHSLFLISASTSGDLAERVTKVARIPSTRIVTLFYLGDRNGSSQILCDLTYSARKNPLGFPKIISKSVSNCTLCAQGSIPLKILGDHFLPKSAHIEQLILRVDHAPTWLSRFLQEFAGKQILRCHYNKGGLGLIRDIFLDMTSLFGKQFSTFSNFSKKFAKTLFQSTPATLQRIIHLDDPGSKKMAAFVHRRFRSISGAGKQLQLLSAKAVNTNPEKYRTKDGTTLVVASCIVSGRSLLSVCQSLRTIQANDSIVFFVGIARTRTKAILDELKANITYGEFGLNDYGLHIVDSIYIPDNVIGRVSPWQEERDTLFALREEFLSDRKFDDSEIWSRISQIDQAEGEARKGLVNNLFWPSPQNRPLRLRRNFAFLREGARGVKLSQADIYFALAAVLHNLRENPTAADQIYHSEHHRTLLSPRCFDRFNDGVVQAAILRAALRPELDYSISADASASMREVLHAVFSNMDSEIGEGAYEFLLAIACDKLRLKPQDLKAVIHPITRRRSLPKKMRYLCNYIELVADR